MNAFFKQYFPKTCWSFSMSSYATVFRTFRNETHSWVKLSDISFAVCQQDGKFLHRSVGTARHLQLQPDSSFSFEQPEVNWSEDIGLQRTNEIIRYLGFTSEKCIVKTSFRNIERCRKNAYTQQIHHGRDLSFSTKTQWHPFLPLLIFAKTKNDSIPFFKELPAAIIGERLEVDCP